MLVASSKEIEKLLKQGIIVSPIKQKAAFMCDDQDWEGSCRFFLR